MNKCVASLSDGYADTLDRTAGAIRGRAARVCNVVTAEMDNYEPGIYTERVLEAIKVLRDQGSVLFFVPKSCVMIRGSVARAEGLPPCHSHLL